MPKIKTPMPPVRLLALSAALLLGACANQASNLPDRSRFARAPLPVAPAGEAICDDGPCLSDRQVGALLNDTIDTACTANDRLAWLEDYFYGGNVKPSCALSEAPR